MSGLYEKLIRPLMFRLDAETAHDIGIDALRLGLSGMFVHSAIDEPILQCERFGLSFTNPLGIAAGFDKNGVVVNQLSGLGFGFVEVGTVTLLPQKGNEKPRMFRLPRDQALINRLGFNNDGAAVVAERLAKLDPRCVVGVNIGKNKDVPNEEAVENYLTAFNLVHPVADYVAVNISSPNTPGLRELQKRESFEELIRTLSKRNEELGRVGSPAFRRPVLTTPASLRSTTSPKREGSLISPPEGGTPYAPQIESGPPNALVVEPGAPDKFLSSSLKPLVFKIAPDLSETEIESIVDACLRFDVSGIIATNTTTSRADLRTEKAEELGPGGLSGRPLAKRSNEVIRAIWRFSNGKLPVIGVGGVFTGQDAFEKIAAGACLIQAYTGFVYQGPAFALSVNSDLAKILKARGFSSLDQAIGSGT